MPFYAEVARSRAIELIEWVTPGGMVLGVSGDLDAMACRALEHHLRRLTARWPGLLLTLDVERVTKVDDAAAESLFLSVVAMRAGEGRLAIASRNGGCRALLARMGVATEPFTSSATRWPEDGWGNPLLQVGVTA